MSTTTLTKGIELFRTLDAEMQAQQMLTFLLVAQRPGHSVKEYGDMVGLSEASSSRNIAYWSKRHRHGRPGQDMVEATLDPMNYSRKLIHLNAKGRRFLALLEGL